ncbi:hypothetical protein B0H67DRAFT_92986 [Lasiosphaeris hirsuta]|uniref:Secreted protein n=1 Tax=Lasiosphaeris hirsuta TaxID=260670 RepID=A0AA40BD34_9PEZI|nr:hypothetical protein B0H67DRAFT_92986 [Lasiosphaeris hirsuta]
MWCLFGAGCWALSAECRVLRSVAGLLQGQLPKSLGQWGTSGCFGWTPVDFRIVPQFLASSTTSDTYTLCQTYVAVAKVCQGLPMAHPRLLLTKTFLMQCSHAPNRSARWSIRQALVGPLCSRPDGGLPPNSRSVRKTKLYWTHAAHFPFRLPAKRHHPPSHCNNPAPIAMLAWHSDPLRPPPPPPDAACPEAGFRCVNAVRCCRHGVTARGVGEAEYPRGVA